MEAYNNKEKPVHDKMIQIMMKWNEKAFLGEQFRKIGNEELGETFSVFIQDIIMMRLGYNGIEVMELPFVEVAIDNSLKDSCWLCFRLAKEHKEFLASKKGTFKDISPMLKNLLREAFYYRINKDGDLERTRGKNE